MHESIPLRGNPYNNLPATVLEVTESALTGIYAVQFMHSMGCSQKYRVQRRNHLFTCLHEDYEIQVGICTKKLGRMLVASQVQQVVTTHNVCKVAQPDQQ